MRKYKLVKRITSVCLALAMTVSLFGCGKEETVVKIEDMEIEDAPNLSFDFIGGEDVMPLMGFYAMTPTENSLNGNSEPDYYTDEIFELIKEAGINTIGPGTSNYATVPQYTKKMLELAGKHDIAVVVTDKRWTKGEWSLEQLDEFINEYANYEAFAGVFMVDEPGAPYFRDHENGTNIEEFGDLSAKLNQLGYYWYGNLLGMHGVATYTEEDEETYYRYVSEWADITNPQVLMYDRYIFGNNNGLDLAGTHFKTLETHRRVAEEHNIPFWAFAETGQQWNDAQNVFDSTEYWPSQGEFFWEVGSMLAFGVKGIGYFPMIQPYYFAWAETDLFDFQRNGILGAAGNKTRWWHYAKAMNEQIAAVDEYLMHAVNKGIIATGDAAREDLSDCMYLMENTSWRELTKVTGDTMIGCFNYNGKTLLYVLNYDTEYAQKVNLEFADDYNITVIQNAETSHLTCDDLELTFQAGDSAMILFE